MEEFFTSEQFRLRPSPSAYFREEILVSPADARRVGISGMDQFCSFSIDPLYPGPREEEYAVHLQVNPSVESGTVLINEGFLNSTGFQVGDERFWSLKPGVTVVPIREAVIELVVEQGNVEREIADLRKQRRDYFLQRCILLEPGRTVKDLSLPILGRGYFNFRSILPSPEALRSKTALVFDDNTGLNLFVPHRKSGVDMVVVVDASNSMDLSDYVGADGRPRSRIEGVKVALEALLRRRLTSGSRVSRIAAMLFGSNTRMLYPLEPGMVELRTQAQLLEFGNCIRYLNSVGLERLGVDRTHTQISGALRYATELLDYHAQENNEKVVVLLSDGADWTEDSEGVSEGEIVRTSHDPAVLADSLHFDSQVRIHTVSISDEQALRRHEDRKYWSQGWAIPNKTLLRKIADSTEGLFLESPDARSLHRLFDELGQGTLFPLYEKEGDGRRTV
jgi:hypothetical protein